MTFFAFRFYSNFYISASCKLFFEVVVVYLLKAKSTYFAKNFSFFVIGM